MTKFSFYLKGSTILFDANTISTINFIYLLKFIYSIYWIYYSNDNLIKVFVFLKKKVSPLYEVAGIQGYKIIV